MQTTNLKNLPDERASLLFLVPGFVLSIFYLITIHSGEATGYFLAALLGIIGFVMSFWKRLRPLRIWEALALGFGLGAASYLITTIGSSMWNPNLPVPREQSSPLARLVVTVAILMAMTGLLGHWMPHSRRLLWAVAGVLLVNSLIAAFILPVSDDSTLAVWHLSWRLGFSAVILGTVWLGRQLSRRSGILALLAVIVAFGTLNAVNLTIADIAEGKSHYGQIALLLAYSVPLVICPAWLLLSHNWRTKKYGVLLSWGVMVVGMVIVLPMIDQFLEPHFFRYPLQPVDIFSGVVEHVPLLIGLWLAFTLHERTNFFPAQ